MGQQIGNPDRSIHVGIAAGHIADVLGIGENQVKVLMQYMSHRFPVHAALHRHVADTVAPQPLAQLQQRRQRRGEAPYLDS